MHLEANHNIFLRLIIPYLKKNSISYQKTVLFGTAGSFSRKSHIFIETKQQNNPPENPMVENFLQIMKSSYFL